MMKRISFILILFLLGLTASASGRRDKILNLVDMEIKELSRLSRISKNRNPETLLRIAELYLEKGRILREDENERLFNKSIEERKKINRKKHFSQSRSYMQKAQKMGVFILKQFKGFKSKSEVYYILAFNEKENGNLARAKSLFLKSVKSSKRKSDSDKKSRLSIADIYYSEGSFSNAKKFYESVINSIKGDRWYTKYLYNLSWANFRLGKQNLAIKQMNEVFTLSRKSEKYVDKSKIAERDLGYFYAESGQTSRAKKFYKKAGGNLGKNFYEMGMFLQDKQKYSQALKMFKSSYYGKDKKYKTKSLIQILSIYDKYNNSTNFLKFAREAMEIKFVKEEKKEVLFWITKRAAILQRDMQQSYNVKRPKVMKQKGSIAAELYVIVQRIDGKLSEKSSFYAAESFFAAGEYEKSLKFYNQVRQQNTKSKFYRLALEGMLTAINKKSVSRKIRNKYFESLYIDYIKSESDLNKKSRAVEKLFSYLIDERQNPAKAESLFFQHASIFPKKIRKNEAMIGRIVDLYKKTNRKTEIFAFVKKLKTQNIGLTNKFVSRLNTIILTTQFQDVQKANSRGNKVMALEGYLRIYKDPSSTPAAKRNSAYNISVLFYELGNSKYMQKWLQRSLTEMSMQEVGKFSDSFSSMINELYLLQDFSGGAAASEQLLSKLCTLRNKVKNNVLNNYVVMGLANGEHSRVTDFIRRQDRCRGMQSGLITASKNVLEYYLDNQNYLDASKTFAQLERKKRFKRASFYYGRLIALKRSQGINITRAEESKLRKLYRVTKNKKSLGEDFINEFALINFSAVAKYATKIKNIKLSFPQEKYNRTLQQKVKMLDRLTKDSISILSVGSGEVMVEVYLLLIDAYSAFVEEIRGFTPPGKSKEYVNSFKKGMSAVTGPLGQRVLQFENELSEQVHKNDVLSDVYSRKVQKGIEYLPAHDYILMDKRGLR